MENRAISHYSSGSLEGPKIQEEERDISEIIGRATVARGQVNTLTGHFRLSSG